MSESAKTVTFIGIALALGLFALVMRPSREAPQVDESISKPLFDKFTDASKASSMKVVRYSEDVGEVHSLEVAKKPGSGLWSIPSHGDYPADAQDQLKDAATCLVGLTVLDIASTDKSDHQMFGVIEPNKDQLKVGDKGVGLLVSFADEKGEPLARLVVGKEVKGNKEQRFVRIPGQDPVYVAKISTDKLSAKFEDWIEKDLLKVQPFDVEGLQLKDYSVVPTVEGYAIQPRSETKVANTPDGKWNLDSMIVYKGRDPVPAKLQEGEELNKEKLDDLKNSLSNVKIVDVYRKPKGLGSTLKASGDFGEGSEARRSLEQRGFIVHPETKELLSANGELHVYMKDGVEYVLRFGNVAGEEEGSKEGKLNRYLFVMARVDESKFPEPKLEPLPEGPSTDAAPAAPGKPTTPAEPAGKPDAKPETKPDAKPETKPDAKPETKPDAKPETKPDAKPETKPDAKPEGTEKPCDVEVQDQDEANPSPGAKGQDDAKKGDSKAETKAAQEPAAPQKPAADKSPAPAPNKPAADTKPAATEEELRLKKLAADRERITKENQRKIDDRQEKLQKAEEKVNELNARFADWYYVISEDVYKKIHLSRSDVVKEGANAADVGTGVDTFRKLESEGLKKTDPSKKPPVNTPGLPPGLQPGLPQEP